MLKIFRSKFFLLLAIIIQIIDCQGEVCVDGLIGKPDDPRWHPIAGRFEIFAEVAFSDGAFEVTQAFTAGRDAIFVTLNGVPFSHYYNFETNEYFTVSTLILDGAPVPLCLKSVIDNQFPTSNVSGTVLKPSILLGYDSKNKINPAWATRFVGETILRGIPVDIFIACFYVQDIQTTVEATYYYSNVTKFHGYLGRNTPILLQIDVKTVAFGKQESYQYNIFRYTPYPRPNQEIRALETPTGYFCKNRNSTKPLPSDLPERLSVNSETQVPQLNNTILSGHELFDKQAEFVRLDLFFGRLGHFTEIHDYRTGLSYRYEHMTQRCTVNDINGQFDGVQVEGQPNIVRMRDGLEFFLLDNTTFHYTGVRHCRERVNCHVWIGEKALDGNRKGTQHREWYWAFEMNGVELRNLIPIKFIMTDLDERGRLISANEITMFNFHRNPLTIFEIDHTLSECYRALGPKQGYNYGVVKFVIANDKEYPVHKNIEYLTLTIWRTLTLFLQLRPVRISNIVIDHDGKDLIVTFLLLDVPPKYGPVEHPLHEHSLDTLVERLQTLINDNTLAFRAKFDTKEVDLRARKNSLDVIYVNNKSVTKAHGPLITGLWIGFLVLGLLLGVGVAFIVVKKYT
ncbi:unnamed protein product [Didymodactylos carnosus]|uniref:Uncharacterized protein n=1 Tax=Didymodactylos carnosus TaxID=1234261 RepID=A0A814HQL7_9BILA|nr:unnamed protein product [Didymodactylos carnosus]CAF3785514.1 unnamed protein product [Didymodactylos carnosus]